MLMRLPLHTVVETPTFVVSAKRAELSGSERDALLDQVMSDPSGGDLIRTSGGVRKMRIAKDDTGKSGGYRVLTYFMDRDAPVFLLLVIDKSEADTITDAQTARLRSIAKAIKDERTSTDRRNDR